MIQNVREYVEPFVTLGIPIEYEKIQLFPFTVAQWYDFSCTIDVFTINKNEIPDIKIIQMSYLQYIVEILFADESMKDIWKQKFYLLLHGSTQIDLDKIGVLVQNGKYYLQVDGVIINATQFEELRRIILYQNISGYDDTPMSADFKKVWNEYMQLKNRNIESPSLKIKIATVQSLCGFSKKEIMDMTLLNFEDVFDSAITWEEYRINHTAEMGGMVKFNKPVEHPVFHKHHDKYADMFVNADEYAKKLTSI